MKNQRLDARDHEMHRIRNRALHHMLRSVLLAARSRSEIARARLTIRRNDQSPWGRLTPQPRRTKHTTRTHLRLVKT
jgi:hypothetical protein